MTGLVTLALSRARSPVIGLRRSMPTIAPLFASEFRLSAISAEPAPGETYAATRTTLKGSFAAPLRTPEP